MLALHTVVKHTLALSHFAVYLFVIRHHNHLLITITTISTHLLKVFNGIFQLINIPH